MQKPPPLPVVLALTALLDGLLEAIGARFGIFPIRRSLYFFLWRRLCGIKLRFENLAARVAAGRGVRARPARPSSIRARRTANPFRLTRWVRPNFGWLCRVVPGALGAPAFAAELRALLATDPTMLALLAATPSTARILRPLCWMLGVPEPPPAVLPATATPGAPPAEPPRADDVARHDAIATIPRRIAPSPPMPMPMLAPDPLVEVLPFAMDWAA